MDLVTRLKQSGDPAAPLSMHSLMAFSNLSPASVEHLRPVWISLPAERRIEIARAFERLAEDSVELNFCPFLLMCLDDPAPEVRATAVSGLWEDERPSTLRHLLRLADDPSSEVRAAVMTGLNRFASLLEMGDLPADLHSQVLETLLRTATDEQQPLDVRRRAVEGIGYFSDSAHAQAEIGSAYAHPDQRMRASALVAMGRSLHPTWFPAISRELKSALPALRYEAARAVGELSEEGQELLPMLLPLVRDQDTEVWQAAVWALGEVGGQQAEKALIELARSNDPARAEAALAALESLSLYDQDHI